MTTPASRYLFALSQQVAHPYTQLPAARAAMVTGSVAEGLSDNYSDVDMSIFYEKALPTEETLMRIREELGGSERKWSSGSLEEGGFVEAFDLHGVEIQMIHTTIARWEATLDEVLIHHKIDTPLPKALEGILVCRALYGEEYIDRWKAKAGDFPDGLVDAMVKHYMSFSPAWALLPHFHTRDATVWYYENLVGSAYKLLGILAGLNRVYFTPFQFKRMGRFVAQLTIAPEDVGTRLERLFHAEPEEALPLLESLVDETLQLVDQHLPHLDTTLVRRHIGWRQQPWQPVPLDQG